MSESVEEKLAHDQCSLGRGYTSLVKWDDPVNVQVIRKQVKGLENCNWYEDWNRTLKEKQDAKCPDYELNFATDKAVIREARQYGCPWAENIIAEIQEVLAPSREYDARSTYGILYTLFLAVDSQNACSIFSLVNPSAPPSFSSIYWLIVPDWPPGLDFPSELLDKDKLSRCLRPLIIIPMILKSHINGKTSAHFNAGVMNLHDKSFERFEPHGEVTPAGFQPHLLDARLKVRFDRIGFTYKGPSQVCPKIGHQVHEGKEVVLLRLLEYSGRCQAWGIWYFDERINNPDVPGSMITQQLLDSLKSQSGIGQFIKFIAQYTARIIHLEKTLISEHNPDNIPVFEIDRWIHANYALLAQVMKQYVKTGTTGSIKYKITVIPRQNESPWNVKLRKTKEILPSM